jgi:hypothetical protein
MTSNNTPQTPPTPVKKKRGCFFYGCITVIFLLVLGCVSIGITTYYLYSALTTNLTTNAPLAVQVRPYTEEQVKIAESTIQESLQKFRTHQSNLPIRIQDKDLEAMLNSGGDVKRQVSIHIKDKILFIEANLPLDQFHLGDRYVHFSADIFVEVRNGEPLFQFKNATFNGQAFGQEDLDKVNGQLKYKVGEQFEKNGLSGEIKDLYFEDNAIVLVPVTPSLPPPVAL